MTEPTELICMSWNLAHQTREVPIRREICDVIEGFGVDIAMFNEFVDGKSRAGFRTSLARLGLACVKVSTRIGRSNQVLIASRYPLEPGDLRSPMPDTVAPANWCHVRVPSHGVEIIQLRMPWWDRAATRTAYRAELAALLEPHRGRALVACGDFNHDPFHRLPADANEATWLGLESFVVERPGGEWSFMNKTGTATSRVDHVAHTKSVLVANARYERALGSVALAGSPVAASAATLEVQQPISDHAPLVFAVRARSRSAGATRSR